MVELEEARRHAQTRTLQRASGSEWATPERTCVCVGLDMIVAVHRVVREARGSSTSIVVRLGNGTRGGPGEEMSRV